MRKEDEIAKGEGKGSVANRREGKIHWRPTFWTTGFPLISEEFDSLWPSSGPDRGRPRTGRRRTYSERTRGFEAEHGLMSFRG